MKEPSILQEQVDCIYSVYSTQHTLGKNNIILTLLDTDTSNNSEPETSIELKLSTSTLYKISSGVRSFSPKFLCQIATSCNSYIEQLCSIASDCDLNFKSNLESKIKELFVKYFPDSFTKISINLMINSLVRLHFFGTDDIENFFYPFDEKRLENCDSYIPWREKETELFHLLQDNHLIFVNGLPASGKKQLVKYCLQTYNWSDLYWLNEKPELSLAKRICEIKFLFDKSDTKHFLKDTMELLKYKTSSSILIIEIPFIESEDYSFIEKYFKNLKLKIIIITKTLDIPNSYAVLNVDKRPVKNLLEIFKSHYTKKHNLLSKENFNKLCRMISYNPFIMTLIAKTLKKCPTSPQINNLLRYDFGNLDTRKFPKIHSSYHGNGKKSGLQITTIAERILDCYDENFLKTVGSELSILAKNEISKSFLLENEISAKDIETSLDLGLLQYTDSSKKLLQMPPIIADVIWMKYPIKYKEYREQIFLYLHQLSIGEKRIFTYSLIYERVLTLVYRFHFQITRMKSRIDKNSKLIFLEWNRTLTEIIHYFIKLGNTPAAENILFYLYMYENKTGIKSDLVPELQLLERDIFQLHIDFVKNDSPIQSFEQAVQLMQNLLTLNTKKNTKLILHIINKIYFFIMDALDSLLLKYALNFEKAAPERLQSIHVIQIFLQKYPWLHDNIFYYYGMIYQYLTENIDEAEYYFNTIDIDSDLYFNARIWRLYYMALYKPTYSFNVFNYISQEYPKLFHEFQNRISTFNTSVLFYYCSFVCNLALPPTIPYATNCLTKFVLENANNIIDAQSFLCEDDKQNLIDIAHQLEQIKHSYTTV